MYFDDALEAAARAAVAAHLAHCDVCRAELDALSAVANAFASWRSEPIPRDVSAPVMARVRQRPAPHTRAHWGIAALGAQAVLAILLAAWVLPQALRVWTGVNLPQLLLPAWSWDAQMFSLPAMPDVSLPLPAMTIWMWGAILAGAVVLWFIGNRLIWRTLSHQQEASQ
jgi:anti-sigma factor RsiW